MTECMFSCHKCGLEKIKFRVRDRGTNEDVVAFTMYARKVAQDVHDIRSPACYTLHLDIYLQLTEAEKAELDESIKKNGRRT